MANGKKSFILYCDMKHTVDLLDDASAGKLLKHLLAYVNDENPIIEDAIVKIAFEPIKQQLKRDLKDWEIKREKRVESGHLGGIKSGQSRRLKQTKQMLQKESKLKQTEANEAVNVSVNGTVNVNESALVSTDAKREVGLGIVVYNAEDEILKNVPQFEKICMVTGKNIELAKISLHKYHLFLEEKEQYPKGRKAVFAGFEKWLINEKNFEKNGKEHKRIVGKDPATDKL